MWTAQITAQQTYWGPANEVSTCQYAMGMQPQAEIPGAGFGEEIGQASLIAPCKHLCASLCQSQLHTLSSEQADASANTERFEIL